MLVLQTKTGGRSTLLYDVWQNITKTHLAGFMMSLFGHCTSLGLYPAGSGHDAVAIEEHMEKATKNSESNDAGQCSRARRILALRWPHLIFLKCFAHDVNNLVKAALRTPSFREVTCQATEVVNTLHASSSMANMAPVHTHVLLDGTPNCDR
ncbi:hypothetical protein PHMEG_0008402 [Phytophthora megakarya]|uniref:DUF659 domain-containing protein n=1 Tax=Phytophthora megakarya TaxID=4795 RepID=A0A225WJ50_9STRA|nr:hypothetical protein PHMEG_0008402 [Phytophthora megakarya]